MSNVSRHLREDCTGVFMWFIPPLRASRTRLLAGSSLVEFDAYNLLWVKGFWHLAIFTIEDWNIMEDESLAQKNVNMLRAHGSLGEVCELVPPFSW
jgi:hypothetical protein